MGMKGLSLVSCSLFLFVSSLFVPLAKGEEAVELEEMLVTGKSAKDPLTERHEESVGKVIIGRKEIESFGDQRAGDVIKRLPGVFIGGPPGENKDVRLRGLDKEYTQILIDGQRITGEGEKREFQVDQIPVDMIERIEIIRNPTAENDQDAVGGIINIILRRAPQKFTVHGRIGSGGQAGEGLFDTRDFSLNVGSGSERFRYQVGGSFLETVLQKDKSKEKPEGLELEDEAKIKQSSEIHFDLSYAVTPHDDLNIRPFFLKADEEKDKEKTKKDGKERELEDEEKEKETSRISVKWKHRFLSSASLEIGGLFNRQKSEKDKIKTKSNLIESGFVLNKTEFEDEKKQDEEWALNGKYSFPISSFDQDHLISVGGKFRDKDRSKRKKKIERATATGIETDTTKPRDNYDLNEEIGALFIQDEFDVNDRLVLTPGFRIEQAKGAFFDLKTGLRGKQRFTTYHPSSHLLYQIRPKTNLRASFVRAIRRPKFDDLIPTTEEKDDRVKLGNPLLAPEEWSNYELSVEQFWTKGFGSLGAFYRDVDGKISEIIVGTDSNTGKDLVSPVNVGDGRVFGFEVEFKKRLALIPFSPFRDMTIRGNYSWFDSKIKDQITGQTRKFKNQPDFVFNLILQYDYKPSGFGATVAWNYIDEQLDIKDDGKRKIEDPRSIVDLSLKKRLGEHFSLFFDIQNLFKEEKVKREGGQREVESFPQIYLFGVRGKW